ncbi:MAG: AAA family ATPase [Patescibacteria group bacterium]|nr:AAA family ATPase [Patescibacteria group bacterium]
MMNPPPAIEWLEIAELDEEPTGNTSLPPALTLSELDAPLDLSENLLGDRWLEYHQGALLYGPAGCGKSVAAHQACCEWAAGLAGLHIQPARPLRIVIIQTEDSLNDLRETRAGILASSCFGPEQLALVRKNLVILAAVPGGNPADLAALLDGAASEYQADLLHVNPLLAWCATDPTKDLGHLLYQVIDPVLKRHRTSFFGVHHTPKMNRIDTSGYGQHDHQYLAAGDARVANWPRAMVMIAESKFPVYRFLLTKRGHRAGWTWDGKPTFERFFKHHSAPEIRWVDAMPAEVEQAEAVENYNDLSDLLPAADKPGISRERIRDLAKNKLGIGKHKADEWTKLLVEDGKLERLEVPTKSKRKEALFRRALEVR